MAEDKDIPQDCPGEELQGNSNDCQPLQKVVPVFFQDLNCLPYDEEEDEPDFQDNEINDESLPGSESVLSVIDINYLSPNDFVTVHSEAMIFYGHSQSSNSLVEIQALQYLLILTFMTYDNIDVVT